MSGTGQMGGTTYFPPSVLDGQAVPGGEVQVEILPPEEAPAGQALGDGGGGGAMQGGAGGIADTPRNATGAPQEAAPPAPAPEAPATPPVAPAPAPVAAAPVVAGDVADSYRAYRDAVDQARQEAELRRRVQRRQPRNAPAIVGSAAAAEAPADGAPPAAMADASGAVPRPRPRRRDSAASAAQAQEPAEVVPPMPDEPGIGARILQAAGTVARNGADGMLQIPGGVIRGVREVFRAADDVANWLNNNVADLRIDVPGLPAPLGNPAAAMAEVVDGLNPIPEPRTPTGRITGEVAQFLSGFLRGNGLLRATGVMQGAGAGAAAGRAAAAGAIADFFFQESGEQNLAAAWRAAGLPENALTEFLATDPNDNAAVNRLRNALTGVAVGAALDGVLALVRTARAAGAAQRGGAGRPVTMAEPAPAVGLADAAGVPARPERDIMIVGDASRPLVEMGPVGDAGARMAEAAAATSDAAMGVGPGVSSRALTGAADAAGRLREFRAPSWIEGATATADDLAARDAAEGLGALPPAMRELIAAMRRGIVGPRGEVSMTAFLRKHGGVQDQGGEIMALLGGTSRTAPGLVSRNGRTIERARELAIENGYLPGTAGQREFLDALADDATGRVRNYGTTIDFEGRALRQAADDLDELLGPRGLSVRDADPRALADALNFEMTSTARGLDDMVAEDAARAAGPPVQGPGGLPLVENTAAIRAATEPGPVFINWGKIATPEDVQAVMRDMADAHRADVNAARRGVQSNDETARLAADLGLTVEDLLSRQRGQPWNAETALAARQLYTASGQQLLASARQAAAPGAGALEQAAFRRMMATHYAIQAEVLGARAETARALQAWAIPAAAGRDQMRMIEDLLEASGGIETAAAMARRLAILGDNLPADQLAQALGSFANRGWGGRTIEAIQQVWINALLSGPATHAANITGNTLNAFLSIAERGVAARIGAARGAAAGEGVMPGEAFAMTYGLMTGWRDALRLAGRTYRDDGAEVARLIGRQDVPRQGAISSQAFGMDAGTGLGRAVDFVGHSVVSAPGRAMGTEDAFFKSVLYRMELLAASLREAYGRLAARGEEATAETLGAEMGRIMRNPPEHVTTAAADMALYATFNRQAGPIASALMRLRTTESAGWNLAASTVLPFVRTPANIFAYSFERTPLAPLVGQWRADVAAGGARRDLALARVATGGMILATAFDAADRGSITGAGPDDPGERAAWLRTHQPYSIRIGDTWVSYNRLDPFGFVAGMAADMSDLFRRADIEPEEVDDFGEVSAALALMVSRSVTSRSFMQGVSNLVEAIDGRNPDPERFIGGIVAGLAAPGGVAALARAMDPVQREAHGLLERIKQRLPGLSQGLIPRRDFWGREMVQPAVNSLSPVRLQPVREDPVDAEILRLNLNLQPLGRNQSFGGVAMNMRDHPRQLDRLRVLFGQEARVAEFGSKGAHEAIAEMIRGEGPRGQAYAMATDGEDGGKGRHIKRVVNAFRDAARQKLLSEDRDFARVVAQRRARAASRAGQAPAPIQRAPRATMPTVQ